MDMKVVRKSYIEELYLLKDVVSVERLTWLRSMTNTEDTYKIQTAIGYVMALRDTGNNIGDIKLYLEYMRRKSIVDEL